MFGITPYEKKDYDIFNAFQDFEKNFFGSDFRINQCRTDIREEKDKYILEAELPGFDKEDIKLDIDGDYLVLSAEHSTDNDEKDKNGRYIRRERTYGSYQRSFDISGINADTIDAEYKNGVLKLTLPKKSIESKSAKRLQIK